MTRIGAFTSAIFCVRARVTKMHPLRKTHVDGVAFRQQRPALVIRWAVFFAGFCANLSVRRDNAPAAVAIVVTAAGPSKLSWLRDVRVHRTKIDGSRGIDRD